MSYLKTIEFLVKEVAKKDQEIKGLTTAIESSDRMSKAFNKVSEKRLEKLVSMGGELTEVKGDLKDKDREIKSLSIALESKERLKQEQKSYK